jgi:uncharacterized membrane protein
MLNLNSHSNQSIFHQPTAMDVVALIFLFAMLNNIVLYLLSDHRRLSSMKNPLWVLLLVISLSAPLSSSFLISSRKSKQAATVVLRESPENQKYATASEKFNARRNAMFERLIQYKEEHGDCLVPQKYEEDPKLGKGVATQRRQNEARTPRQAELDWICMEC